MQLRIPIRELCPFPARFGALFNSQLMWLYRIILFSSHLQGTGNVCDILWNGDTAYSISVDRLEHHSRC